MAFFEDWAIARTLVALQVDQLVCGAMPEYLRDLFESNGVRVIDCQKGGTQDFFERFKLQVRETECASHTIGVGHQGPLK